MNKIRYLVHNVNSKRDIYGNCYWTSEVTATNTGKSLSFNTPHESNTNGMMRTFLDWEAFKVTSEEVPIREFDRRGKFIMLNNSCKDEAILQAIKDLERGE